MSGLLGSNPCSMVGVGTSAESSSGHAGAAVITQREAESFGFRFEIAHDRVRLSRGRDDLGEFQIKRNPHKGRGYIDEVPMSAVPVIRRICIILV